jgi:hypothetical protein
MGLVHRCGKWKGALGGSPTYSSVMRTRYDCCSETSLMSPPFDVPFGAERVRNRVETNSIDYLCSERAEFDGILNSPTVHTRPGFKFFRLIGVSPVLQVLQTVDHCRSRRWVTQIPSAEPHPRWPRRRAMSVDPVGDLRHRSNDHRIHIRCGGRRVITHCETYDTTRTIVTRVLGGDTSLPRRPMPSI